MIYAVTFEGQKVRKVEQIDADREDLDDIEGVIVYAADIYEAVEKAASQLGITVDPPRLYGITDVAAELGWSSQRVHTYMKRGILPKPATQTGSRPAWTQLQMERIKKKYRKK